MKRLILLVLSFLCWQGMVLAEGEATPKYSISGDTLYYEGSIVEWCEDPITSITYFTLFIEGQEIKGDLVIPEGVDTIATGAFRNCSELTSVSFPKSLESVEDDAFFDYGNVMEKVSTYSEFYNFNYYFSNIDTLSYLGTIEEWCEDPITSINYFSLFIEGQEIKGDLVIPEGVDTIATGAFRNCSELTSVSFPKSLVGVEDDAFGNVRKISTYSEFYNLNYHFGVIDTLSFLGTMEEWCEDPITSITYYTLFIEGQEIKGDLVIPEGVDTIATGAFSNCSELLTSVSFPKSLECVEDDAFFDFGNMGKISMYSEFYNFNHYFSVIDTLSFLGTIEEWCASPILDISYKTLFIDGKEIKGSLIIPEGVDTIAYGAFDRCSLTSVRLPKSINSVEEYSFPSVDTLYYSGSMEKWCESPVVHLDYSNLFIEDYEVKYDLFIPPVSKIANYAFSRCTLLQNVIFHDNRAFVEEYAFPPIERLQYMGSIEEWCESPIVNLPYYVLFIDGNEIKDDLVIPEGVTYISREAFRFCSLTSVTLPQSIEFVDDDAFEFVDTLFYSGSMKKWCESPISTWSMYYSVLYVDGQEVSGDLVVPEGVEYISSEAFSNCPYITSVSFPKSLNSLNGNAFSNNTNVRKVSCYSSYPIDEKAEFFSNNDTLVFLGSMQEWCASPIVNLPYSVLFIDGKEIKDDLVIPEGVTAISDNAFSKCPQISSVTFPQSMLHIGENAFANCTRIRSITCHSPYPPEVFANSFANYNSYLYMPCDHFDEYDLHVTWGSFKYVECSSSDVTDVEGLEIITVEEDVFYFSSEVKVSVYDMLGRCLYSCDGVGSYQVPSKGVYLVKSGFDTVKVVVD